MTKFIDARKIKEISLPSYPDVKIELYDCLLTGEAGQLRETESDHERGLQTLVHFIKSWTFVDELEKPVPITTDNLNKLPIKDVEALMSAVDNSLKEAETKKKKN